MFEKSPIDDNPVIVKQRKKLVELQLKKIDLEKKWNNIGIEKSSIRTAIEKKAELLVQDGQIDLIKTNTQLEQSSEEIKNEIKAYELAIEKQRKIIEETISQISKEYCIEVKPQYKKIIERIAKALIELTDASEEERKFFDGLFQNSVKTAYLPVGCYTGIQPGELSNSYHRAAYWARDMIKQGYLSASMFPKKRREDWFLDKVNK